MDPRYEALVLGQQLRLEHHGLGGFLGWAGFNADEWRAVGDEYRYSFEFLQAKWNPDSATSRFGLAQRIGEDLLKKWWDPSPSDQDIETAAQWFALGIEVDLQTIIGHLDRDIDLDALARQLLRFSVPNSRQMAFAMLYEIDLEGAWREAMIMAHFGNGHTDNINYYTVTSQEEIAARNQIGMFCSDAIARAITEQEIRLKPVPDLGTAINGSSLDLTLGTRVSLPRQTTTQGKQTRIIDTRQLQLFADELYELYILPDDGHCLIWPGWKVLWYTQEELSLPASIEGHLDLRSSIAEVLTHAGSNKVHEGYSGRLKLELQNTCAFPLQLYVGQSVAQITFTRLGESGRPYFRRAG